MTHKIEVDGPPCPTCGFRIKSRKAQAPVMEPWCGFCDLDVPAHEDELGFHHVIDGERVACTNQQFQKQEE